MPNLPALAAPATTYVVELTPAGRGAVAVVLVAGPLALQAVAQCFVANSGRTLAQATIDRIVVGHWGGPDGEEVVVCRRREDVVEVHSHGGIAAVRSVIGSLVAMGCRELGWRQWLRCRGTVSPQLPIPSRRDATTLDAQIALADAVTLRTAGILLDQLNGALSRAVHEILNALASNRGSHAATLLECLWRWREFGIHLTSPWRVVFVGPPNVGKSSLMNALAGFERAIVSPEPGTTRDVVTLSTAIEGWPVELADTAGLRRTADELESAGVALTGKALAHADMAVLVVEAAQPEQLDGLVRQALPARVLVVHNKIDLLSRHGGIDHLQSNEMIETSALLGTGVSELARAIGAMLVPEKPPAGAAVPFTAEQVEAIASARQALTNDELDAASDALQSMLASH